MSLNNARLFNSDLVLIDVMLHFLLKKKRLFNSSELSCGFNVIIIFQNEKKKTTSIFGVYMNTFNIIKAIQLILLTNNIVGLFFINVHVQLRT